MSVQHNTFLWHDYETWGINPALDRPAQFAAIRTDEDLNIIGDPLMLYCQPPRDMLPSPEACLITGITPQYAMQHGVIEAEFIKIIEREMMQPGTCSAGFNSIRFDDEVTRFTLYRNFYDAYEREWKNGNSRWDIMDVVRLCAAVRPEGIQWPVDAEGLPSMRLELLTSANNIEQKGAHDALVDVRATIDVARLIKQKQPKLFTYALRMRNKHTVANAIELGSFKPLLHISGKFGLKNYCASIVLPLCMHPTNKNVVICFDLRESPEDFLTLSVEELRYRTFTARDILGDKKRIPLKNIHLNKSPMVAPVKMVNDEVAKRINIDLLLVKKHYDALMLNQTSWMRAQEIFIDQAFAEKTDVDVMLYSGGFFSNADKATMARIRKATPVELAQKTFVFEDARLNELFFRYRGRNYPETLNRDEQEHWREYCSSRLFSSLTDSSNGGLMTMEKYQSVLEDLYMKHESDEKKSAILSDLMDWGDTLQDW